MVRGEREPEKDHIQSDAPMATDGDRHADDDDEECDQLNRTYDHEPDNMSNNDDDVNDHNDIDDDDDNDDAEEPDDDDDAEEAHIECDVPVCKSCGNFVPPYASRSQMSRPQMRSLRRARTHQEVLPGCAVSALRSFWSREQNRLQI